MLKSSFLTILSALILTSSAFANESSTATVQAVDGAGISFTDVSEVSKDWANGDAETYKHIIRYFNPEAAKMILKAVPELKENKRALVSLTIGLVMINEQKPLDIQKVMINLSTHAEVLKKSKLTVEEVFYAITTMNI